MLSASCCAVVNPYKGCVSPLLNNCSKGEKDNILFFHTLWAYCSISLGLQSKVEGSTRFKLLVILMPTC